MRAILSKEVTERHRVFEFVMGLLETFRSVLVEKLQSKVWPSPEGDQTQEEGQELFFLTPLSGMARMLGDADQELVAKDDALRLAIGEELILREERAQLSRKTLDQMIGFRNAVTGLFVRPNLDALGLQAFQRRRPVWVVRRSWGIIKALNSSKLTKMLGERLFDDEADLFDRLVVQLRASVRELSRSHRQVTLARRQVQLLRVERKRLLDSYGVLFVRTCRIFEDLCQLVGESELAARLRPSGRRPGLLANDPSFPAIDQQVEAPSETL